MEKQLLDEPLFHVSMLVSKYKSYFLKLYFLFKWTHLNCNLRLFAVRRLQEDCSVVLVCSGKARDPQDLVGISPGQIYTCLQGLCTCQAAEVPGEGADGGAEPTAWHDPTAPLGKPCLELLPCCVEGGMAKDYPLDGDWMFVTHHNRRKAPSPPAEVQDLSRSMVLATGEPRRLCWGGVWAGWAWSIHWRQKILCVSAVQPVSKTELKLW